MATIFILGLEVGRYPGTAVSRRAALLTCSVHWQQKSCLCVSNSSGIYRWFYQVRIGSTHNHGSYFPQHWFEGTGMGINQKPHLMANVRPTFRLEHGSQHSVFQRAIGADAVAVRNWVGFNRLVVIGATVLWHVFNPNVLLAVDQVLA